MKNAIYFDLDGTLADLYAVSDWLDHLTNERTDPYAEAKVMLNMALLARYLHKVQNAGYHIGIISWLSKNGTMDYNMAVYRTKLEWLEKHLPSVEWNEIQIVPYGTPKSEAVLYGDGILFDDEEPNRTEWGENAYMPNEIMEVLKGLL